MTGSSTTSAIWSDEATTRAVFRTGMRAMVSVLSHCEAHGERVNALLNDAMEGFFAEDAVVRGMNVMHIVGAIAPICQRLASFASGHLGALLQNWSTRSRPRCGKAPPRRSADCPYDHACDEPLMKAKRALRATRAVRRTQGAAGGSRLRGTNSTVVEM